MRTRKDVIEALPPETNWLSVFQVAQRLHCSCKTVRILIEERAIHASRFRKRGFRILESHLNEYMKAKQYMPSKPQGDPK